MPDVAQLRVQAWDVDPFDSTRGQLFPCEGVCVVRAGCITCRAYEQDWRPAPAKLVVALPMDAKPDLLRDTCAPPRRSVGCVKAMQRAETAGWSRTWVTSWIPVSESPPIAKKSFAQAEARAAKPF